MGDASKLAEITADQPARVAVAGILLTLFDVVEANLAGTLADTDPECLHDLRVGVRRTRSLLKLTGDVLPRRFARRYAARFKWLGGLTTPVRDLDVHLLAFDELAADVPAIRVDDLEPFREHLRRQRAVRFTGLVRGLSGSRLTTLRERWRQELTAAADPEGATGPSGPAAGELAAERIGRARTAVRKRTLAATPESPADDLHDLRKRAKELRYLLEAFGPLYGKRTRRSVKELKRMQDVLGRFQDAQVQLAAVHEYASGLASAPPALGELAVALENRGERARADLTSRRDIFLSRRPAARE